MTQAPGALPTPTVLDYERTLILAIELSNTSWVLAAQIPGLPGVKAKRSIEPTPEAQPSSVPVDRRARRAKSDGIDAELLLRTLLAWLRGEPRVCSMVPIPDEADEDARRRVRERAELVAERAG